MCTLEDAVVTVAHELSPQEIMEARFVLDEIDDSQAHSRGEAHYNPWFNRYISDPTWATLGGIKHIARIRYMLTQEYAADISTLMLARKIDDSTPGRWLTPEECARELGLSDDAT